MNRTQATVAAALMLIGLSSAHAAVDANYDAPFNRSYLLGTSAAEARSAHAESAPPTYARAPGAEVLSGAAYQTTYDAPFNRSYLLGVNVAEARHPTVAAPAAKHSGSAVATAVERGRYLVRIGGCNDCHTAGYPEAAGKLPEGQWLTGSAVGFRGPWGTTYPTNLRLVLAPMSEAQWLARARSEMRPPMPWFNLRDMTDDDLKAIYHYVRQLGPAGQPAPLYAAPGQMVDTPYIVFEPQNVTARHARTR